MTTAPSFAEFYQTDQQYAGFEQEHRKGGTFDISIFDVKQGTGEFIDPPVSEFIFVSLRQREAVSVEVNFGDGWKQRTPQFGVLDVQPADTECGFRLPSISCRIASMAASKLESCLDTVGVAPKALESCMGTFRSVPRASASLERLWQAARLGDPMGTLEVDAAFLSMIAELLRANGDARCFEPVPVLDDCRLSRVVDYVEAHIESPLTVGNLAQVACVSTFHFGRMFKSAIGETPH